MRGQCCLNVANYFLLLVSCEVLYVLLLMLVAAGQGGGDAAEEERLGEAARGGRGRVRHRQERPQARHEEDRGLADRHHRRARLRVLFGSWK